MLDLDPESRITAEGALAHPYLAQYSDPTDEPNSEAYDQSFEAKELDVPEWKSEYLFCHFSFANLKGTHIIAVHIDDIPKHNTELPVYCLADSG